MNGIVLGVAGVGLIGGSLALRARRAGARVIGFDRDPEALRAASAAGALDDVAPDLDALAERSQVVALALPIDATVTALESVEALALPQLVFDVASVKRPVAAAGRRFPRFVASHPLAGREVGGFGAADPQLFEGRAWVVDPGGDVAARRRLHALIEACGARVVELNPSEHDRLVAVSSHLPQLLSVVLGARLAAAAAGDARAYDVCGPGIASMLRLARSPEELWTAIARANSEPLAAELRAVAGALETIAAELDRGEAGALQASFEHAAHAVEGLERRAASERSVSDALNSG